MDTQGAIAFLRAARSNFLQVLIVYGYGCREPGDVRPKRRRVRGNWEGGISNRPNRRVCRESESTPVRYGDCAASVFRIVVYFSFRLLEL